MLCMRYYYSNYYNVFNGFLVFLSFNWIWKWIVQQFLKTRFKNKNDDDSYNSTVIDMFTYTQYKRKLIFVKFKGILIWKYNSLCIFLILSTSLILVCFNNQSLKNDRFTNFSSAIQNVRDAYVCMHEYVFLFYLFLCLFWKYFVPVASGFIYLYIFQFSFGISLFHSISFK